MAYKTLKLALVISLGFSGCSESGNKQITEPYVTNAEYVLERIEIAEKSGVAFQVKPIRTTACKHMYIEIGQKSASGQWRTTNSIYPGKDNRNNFGQNDLENQVHFAEVDGVGEFGVLALGCEPYGGELQVAKGLLATFEVEIGKLNYIGELALIPVGSGPKKIYKVEVADRTEFALEQIKSQLPELETHLQSNIMEKYVVEITPKMQAELDRVSKRQKQFDKELANAKLTIAARNFVFDEYEKSKKTLELWDEENGYPMKDQSTKQTAERETLLRKQAVLGRKIDKYDDWVERLIPFPLTQQYMKLDAVADRARRNKDAKFPFNVSYDVRNARSNNPEYKTLSDARDKADAALKNFAKLHDL